MLAMYLATLSLHWVRGGKQNSTFWCSWPYNRGRDCTILWETVWFVKVKQDFLDKPRGLSCLAVQQNIELFHTPYLPKYKAISLHSLQLSENTCTGYI